MTTLKKFVPVMITPFGPDANIDYNSLSDLIEFYISAGVKGLFTNCLSSEMYHLDREEMINLASFVVKTVNGRVPVVATSSFGDTIEEKAEFTKAIYQTGIEAAILISSHFTNENDGPEVLMRNLEKMLELTGNIDLGLYECPLPFKRILSAEELDALLKTNRFVYYKDTSLIPAGISRKLDNIKSRGNTVFEFYDAHTPNTLQSLRAGAKGMSAIAGNFYPEIMVWICDHFDDMARQEDIEWIQREITAVDPLIHEAYPLSAKYFLQKRGIISSGDSRVLNRKLSADERDRIDELFQKFLGWCKRLAIEPIRIKSAEALS